MSNIDELITETTRQPISNLSHDINERIMMNIQNKTKKSIFGHGFRLALGSLVALVILSGGVYAGIRAFHSASEVVELGQSQVLPVSYADISVFSCGDQLDGAKVSIGAVGNTAIDYAEDINRLVRNRCELEQAEKLAKSIPGLESVNQEYDNDILKGQPEVVKVDHYLDKYSAEIVTAVLPGAIMYESKYDDDVTSNAEQLKNIYEQSRPIPISNDAIYIDGKQSSLDQIKVGDRIAVVKSQKTRYFMNGEKPFPVADIQESFISAVIKLDWLSYSNIYFKSQIFDLVPCLGNPDAICPKMQGVAFRYYSTSPNEIEQGNPLYRKDVLFDNKDFGSHHIFGQIIDRTDNYIKIMSLKENLEYTINITKEDEARPEHYNPVGVTIEVGDYLDVAYLHLDTENKFLIKNNDVVLANWIEKDSLK
jgi:hypothetical protein